MKVSLLTSLKIIRERLLPAVLITTCCVLTTVVPASHAQQSLLPAQVTPPVVSGERTTPPPVAVDEADEQPPGQRAQQGGISQRRALELARARFAGTVISINEVRARNAPMRYRIRMDNEGNIFTVFVDSVSGAITRE